ncbi:MAG: polyprenyl synthetase family protein [Clostridia bacterium]|nr:polyprenyl synthetase family protein [Clostridia bacterium]
MSEEFKRALTENALAVERELLSLYPETENPDIADVYGIEKYSLTAGGKRIRPFLVTAFCKAFSSDPEKDRPAALRLAAAVEMMHTFSLIHDDLPCMDNDDLRRGRPTSHVVFGEAQALLGGDSLSIRAFETVMSAPMSDAARCRAAYALARAAGSDGMIGGQMADMRGEKEKLDFETLLTLHALKTGKMIVLSAELGCIAAGVPDGDPRLEAAKKYASRIGLAFQVIDDILDATSSAEVLGKSTGKDEKSGKTTFLSFMTAERAHGYAATLTAEAESALDGYEKCGLLKEFAGMLLERKK